MNNQNQSSPWQGIGTFWDYLTKPHPSITEVGEQRRARLLSALSLFLVISFTWAILSNPRTLSGFFAFLGITITAYVLSRTRYFGVGAYFISFAFTSIAYINIYNGSANSIDTSIGSIVPISLILASAILSQRGFLILAIATVAATATVQSYADPKFLDDPLFSFGRTVGIIFSTNFILYAITVFRANVESARIKELQEINRELESLSAGLEKRVAERTQALSHVAEISTAASGILEPDKLLQHVVDLSKTRFNFYHSHIYLLNETEDRLVLAAGAGEPGRRMVAEGRSIPLETKQSLVARAAREQKGVTVNDVTQDPDFLPNPLLPGTRSELAVPMMIGNQVLGVFDVQSDKAGNFSEADIAVQTALASHIASAVQNARLYSRAEAATQEAQTLVNYAPEAIVIVDLETGLFADPNENAERLYGLPRDELVKVGPAQMSPPRQPDGRDSTEKAMEKINDAMQGKAQVFDWTHRNSEGQDIPCEVRLVRLPGAHPRVRASVTDITERKRLEELTTQRVRQQEAINLISQKIQSAATIESALQTAARELGRALGHKPTLVTIDPSALTTRQKDS